MRLLLLIVLSLFFNAAQALPGFYIQAQAGIGGLYTKDYSAEDNPYGNVAMQSGLADRFSVGYLFERQAWQYGVETGYQNLPQNKYSFDFPTLPANGYQKYTANTVDLLGVVLYRLDKLASRCYLLGKLGAARISQTLSGQTFALNTFFNANQTNNQIKFEAVAGAGYQITPRITADISYQHIFANKADPASNTGQLNTISAVNTVMVAFAYHFDTLRNS